MGGLGATGGVAAGQASVAAVATGGGAVGPNWAALQLQCCVSWTGARAHRHEIVVIPLPLEIPMLAPIVERSRL